MRFRGKKGEPERPRGVWGAFLLGGGDGAWLSRGKEAAGGEGDLSLGWGRLVAEGAWGSGVRGGAGEAGFDDDFDDDFVPVFDTSPPPPPPTLVGKTNWALTPEAKMGVPGVDPDLVLVASEV